MTESKTRTFAVGVMALTAAGVIGAVTALTLVRQDQVQSPSGRQVRTVSDEVTVAPTVTAAEASAAPVATETSPAAVTSAAASPSVPMSAGATTSNVRKGQSVTEPMPTPADPPTSEPPSTPPASDEPGGVETPPVGPPPPLPPGMECLPQEIGINPRCPMPTPQS